MESALISSQARLFEFDYKYKPNPRKPDSNSLLYKYAQEGNMDNFNFLLKMATKYHYTYSIDNRAGTDEYTPLMGAVKKGNWAVASKLLEMGHDPL